MCRAESDKNERHGSEGIAGQSGGRESLHTLRGILHVLTVAILARTRVRLPRSIQLRIRRAGPRYEACRSASRCGARAASASSSAALSATSRGSPVMCVPIRLVT